MRLIRTTASLALLLVPSAALAEGEGKWGFNSQTEEAIVTSASGSQLSLSCMEGDLLFFLTIPRGRLAPTVDRATIHFAADDDAPTAGVSAGGKSRGDLSQSGESYFSFRVVEGIDRWLDEAAKAQDEVVVGIVPTHQALAQDALWVHFPALGATDVIAQLKVVCAR